MDLPGIIEKIWIELGVVKGRRNRDFVSVKNISILVNIFSVCIAGVCHGIVGRKRKGNLQFNIALFIRRPCRHKSIIVITRIVAKVAVQKLGFCRIADIEIAPHNLIISVLLVSRDHGGSFNDDSDAIARLVSPGEILLTEANDIGFVIEAVAVRVGVNRIGFPVLFFASRKFSGAAFVARRVFPSVLAIRAEVLS